MGDEDNFMAGGEADADQELEVGRKVGFIPAAAIKILKWAALGIAAIIFIVTVVVITVSVMGRGETQTGYPGASQSYQGPVPIYSSFALPEIRGRTADQSPVTFIVEANLAYEQNNKVIQTELIGRTVQLEDLVRSFFSDRTADQLTPENEQTLKAQLIEEINRIMTTGKIKDIYFTEYNVVPLS